VSLKIRSVSSGMNQFKFASIIRLTGILSCRGNFLE